MSAATCAREGNHALHNMSAPPRSVLTLKPFRPAEPSVPTKGGAAWGLSWRLRVAVEAVIQDAYPEMLPPDIADLRNSAYLVGAVALARKHRGLEADPETLFGHPFEALADELVRLAPGAEEVPELPRQMMVSFADGVDREPARDVAVVLAVLTHLCGSVCDLSASARVAPALLNGAVLDLWAPEGGARA